MRKRLSLHRETVRHLQIREFAVEAIHGGITTNCPLSYCVCHPPLQGTSAGPTACGGCGTNTCTTCLNSACAATY